MKKVLALLAALSLLAFAGSAFATTITATPSSVMLIRDVISTAVATVTGTPAHGGRLAFSKVSGPDWATIDGTTVTFTIDSSVATGVYSVTIRVTETYGDDPSAAGHATPQTETAETTITANVFAIVPVRISTATPSVALEAGSTATATVTGTPMNNGTVAYSIVTGPTWATLSGNTLTFAPDKAVSAGAYNVVVRATETFTLPDGTSRTTTADVTVTANVSAYVIPVTPTTSSDKTTGDEDSKKAEAPVAVKTETKTVTTTVIQTKTISVQVFANAVVAAEKLVTTVRKEEVTQSVTQATNSAKVEVTQATTSAVATVLETSSTVLDTTTGAITNTQSLAASVISAVTSTSTSTTPTANQQAATASKTAIAAALLGGQGGDGTTGNLSNITAKAKAGETVAETLLRVVNEVIAKAAEVLESAETKSKIESLVVGLTPTGGVTLTLEVKETATLTNTTTTKTIVNADGSETIVEDDEAPSFTDVMAMLAAQTAQEQTDADSTGSAEDQARANAKASEVAQEVPVAVIPPVEAPERGIYKVNPPIQKEDTYNKPIKLRTLKQKKGGTGGASFTFSAAAIDAGEDGTGVFLNSAGDVVENMPGKNEWTPDGDPIIPGMIVIAMYMEPGTAYTPLITTTSEAASEVEGISTTQETQETAVAETKTTTLVIPVYDTPEYSTSFDQAMISSFESRDFNTSVGLFIVSGEAGAYSLSAAEDNMLAATDRAVVQTLPKIAPKGEYASDLAMYIIKTRYRIPANTATSKISSADHLLEFWPDGLVSTNAAGQTTTATAGEAIFFDSTGTTEVTDETIRAVAAGQAGYAINSTTRGYDGYVAIALAKISDDADPYRPVITVKLEDVVSGDEPVIPDQPTSPDQPGGPDQPTSPDQPVTTTLGLSASASTVNIVLGETRTITLSAANIQGTASYTVSAPEEAGVTLSGATATITPTEVGTYTVRFTVTDSGRTTNNTATATVTVNVTEDTGTVGGVGSSGGGCDSGFGALALAVLGFIAARKK